MAILLFPLIFAGMAIGIVALVMSWYRKRADVWRHFAASHRLHFRESSWSKPPVISGFYRGTAVTLTLEYRGSGNSRQTFTKATTRFGAQLPQGMKLAREGFSATLARFFGGQDIQVGIVEVDNALRIQGPDPEDIKRLLLTGNIGRLVVSFISGGDDALITQQGASLLISGHASRTDQLQALLDHTNQVVRAIEHELRWDPRRAPEHVPTPRLSPRQRRASPKPTPEPTDSDAEARDGGGSSGSSLADAMIAGLAADGVAESAGRFTLDRDVARKKMQEFQLAEPAAYVLELVQAAVAKGAQEIRFDIDSNDMRLRFDGGTFTEEDFDQLYASLFTKRADADTRARQRLAIGVNAAVGTEPKYIHVTSRTADGAMRLVLKPGEEDRIEPLDPDDLELASSTEIHVKSRLRQRLAGRNEAVQKQLETRCRYAEPVITLNGKRVSEATALVHAFGVVRLGGDGLRGACGFTDRLRDRGEVRLITDGVWISSFKIRDTTPGLLAVVESDRFNKDLSQAEIIQDDAFHAALDAVYDAELSALNRFATTLIHLLPNRDFPATWALRLLRARCRCYSSVEEFQPGGEAAELAKAPLWPTVAGTLVSLRSLIRPQRTSGRVDYADYALTALHLDAHGLAQAGLPAHEVLLINWRTDPRDAAFLAHLLGDRLHSVNDRLLQYLG